MLVLPLAQCWSFGANNHMYCGINIFLLLRYCICKRHEVTYNSIFEYNLHISSVLLVNVLL